MLVDGAPTPWQQVPELADLFQPGPGTPEWVGAGEGLGEAGPREADPTFQAPPAEAAGGSAESVIATLPQVPPTPPRDSASGPVGPDLAAALDWGVVVPPASGSDESTRPPGLDGAPFVCRGLRVDFASAGQFAEAWIFRPKPLLFGRVPRPEGVADVPLQIEPTSNPGNFHACTMVSQRHFRMGVLEGDAVIEDQKSANGTMVDGARLTAGVPVGLTAPATVVVASVLELHVDPRYGGDGSLDAVVVRRILNVPQRAYVFVARALKLVAGKGIESGPKHTMELAWVAGALQLRNLADDGVRADGRAFPAGSSLWLSPGQFIQGQSPGEPGWTIDVTDEVLEE